MSVIFPLGVGLMGVAAILGLFAAFITLGYAVLWVWMLVDGVLRTDAEYPGSEPNRKILWVLAMVFLHPAAIVYFFAVYLKARRDRQVPPTAYTPTVAPPVPPAPEPPRPL